MWALILLKYLLKDDYLFYISSLLHYLPVTNTLAISHLVASYVFLFPILDLCTSLADGTKPNFPQYVQLLSTWFKNRQELTPTRPKIESPELPELDSYLFVRAGLWYQVLARDNWTCLSCRRSTKEHGIVLYVDHILPRSKGGKDELSNLQTLCLKCNIGKSNRDSTDLRWFRLICRAKQGRGMVLKSWTQTGWTEHRAYMGGCPINLKKLFIHFLEGFLSYNGFHIVTISQLV